MLLLTQAYGHLIDLTVEDAQLALRIAVKIDRTVAVQNLIDIIRKGGDPLIPLVSADAEDQHEEQRKPCGCQPGANVEEKADGAGGCGEQQLPQQCLSYLFVFSSLIMRPPYILSREPSE